MSGAIDSVLPGLDNKIHGYTLSPTHLDSVAELEVLLSLSADY